MDRKWPVGVWSMVCTLLLTVSGATAERADGFASFYSRLSISPPAASRLTVCYGFDCRHRAVIDFGRSDRNSLARIFARARTSPRAERDAVARAVGWFDRRIGPVIGTTRRVARASALTRDRDHNFDCIDTSTNTTSLLLLLADWGLLRHHRVGTTAFRGNLLVGQTMHNTAVLIERAGGQEWSIDMWTTKYGDRAEVMPIEQWLRAR